MFPLYILRSERERPSTEHDERFGRLFVEFRARALSTAAAIARLESFFLVGGKMRGKRGFESTCNVKTLPRERDENRIRGINEKEKERKRRSTAAVSIASESREEPRRAPCPASRCSNRNDF